MLGLNKDVVALTPYRQEWKELFLQEKVLLESLIGEYIVDIEHIGSTAIEGIAAKPMLDILIGLRSLDDVKKFDKHCLKKADIYHLGRVEIDGKEVFAKFSDLEELTKTHVYHVVEYGGDWWKQHTFFRDYLNKHPDIAQKYAALKKKLALKYPDNERKYTDAKKAFVDDVLRNAED
ncbi:GrpB family protein [Sporosarcina sp. Marseille-Q4943]|uniref:GrpB family protein n=1 Tax=Sporosarcina sp. Marseille-Q4943 TaxID=2942204 RepID=UPI00208DB7FC|nr:GrpB family protein [Sporosarcina sp. Marseille-Q4943]